MSKISKLNEELKKLLHESDAWYVYIDFRHHGETYSYAQDKSAMDYDTPKIGGNEGFKTIEDAINEVLDKCRKQPRLQKLEYDKDDIQRIKETGEGQLAINIICDDLDY